MYLQQNIKMIRSRFRMSQAVFSKIAGIAATTLSMYETGRREPSVKFLLWMESITGFTISEMYNTEINILELPDPIPNRKGKVLAIPVLKNSKPNPPALASGEIEMDADTLLRAELARIHQLIAEIESRVSRLEEKAKR